MKIDYKGRKLGKLLGIRRSHRQGNSVFWVFKCECGNEKTVRCDKVLQGRIKTCGECGDKNTKEECFSKLIFRNYKSSAKDRSKSFSIDFDYFLIFYNGKCHYCGGNNTSDFYKGFSDLKIKWIGLDRINNSIGYEVGNIVSCCSICNKAKGKMMYNDFKNWISMLIENNKTL